MPNPGSFGRIRVFEDWLATPLDLGGAVTANTTGRIGQLMFTHHEEGTMTITTDEPGGVLAVTTDTGDNDNVCIFCGPFCPADGGVVMEARFKIDDIDDIAIFCGFTETLSISDGEPVLPASRTSTALTIAGSGGVAGLLHDYDAGTDSWYAAAGDGGADASDLATAEGTVSGAGDIVNDEWDVVRVELDVNGDAKIYHDGQLVDDVGSCVTATDMFYAVLMAEVRDNGGAQVLENDYFYAEGGRDWTV